MPITTSIVAARFTRRRPRVPLGGRLAVNVVESACGGPPAWRSGVVPLIPTLATGDIVDGMVATVCRFNGGGSRGVNDAETNGAGRSTRGERGGASNVFT
jgi:hypothetical protein